MQIVHALCHLISKIPVIHHPHIDPCHILVLEDAAPTEPTATCIARPNPKVDVADVAVISHCRDTQTERPNESHG